MFLHLNSVFCTQNQKIAGPTTKFFVWQLNSVFVFKSKYCTSDNQIQHFENIFLMFSFFVFCTQRFCLIKKKKKFSFISHYPLPLSHRRSSRRRSLLRSRLMCLSVGFVVVTWASDLSCNKLRGGAASQWCLGFAISFAGSCWVAISSIGSSSRWLATRGGLCGGRVGLAISPIGSGGLCWVCRGLWVAVVGCGFAMERDGLGVIGCAKKIIIIKKK